MSEITVSLMTEADVDAIHAIEVACFKTPWSRESILHEVTGNECARYVVLREDGEPIAYAGVWFILDEGHITNIAVRPDRRRMGYGERVCREMIQLAADSGMNWMTLEVRRSNKAAQELYHKLGFIDVGYRKRYYENTEDALVMALEHMPEAHPDNDPFLVEE
ncbi:MAG: ribosomal protein S18-alanine N-acetyltransferase [Clostridia bacterium]|nr:ribosomal protein S18-alanine N-acetyltransferase [Clostridia bacterium]